MMWFVIVLTTDNNRKHAAAHTAPDPTSHLTPGCRSHVRYPAISESRCPPGRRGREPGALLLEPVAGLVVAEDLRPRPPPSLLEGSLREGVEHGEYSHLEALHLLPGGLRAEGEGRGGGVRGGTLAFACLLTW